MSIAASVLRDMIVRVRVGLPTDQEKHAEIFDVLDDLITLVEDKSDSVYLGLDELGDAVREIADQRDAAVRELAEEKDEHEKRLEEIEGDHNAALNAEEQKRLDMEKSLDEWRRRAERAEHDLAEAVRNGHGIDRDAAEKLAQAVAIAEQLGVENERLKDGATRLREQQRRELVEEMARDADREALDLVERKHRDIVDENRRLSALLREMAQATPESALRAARIAVGREVIEQTGTLAEPAYRIRKRRKTTCPT